MVEELKGLAAVSGWSAMLKMFVEVSVWSAMLKRSAMSTVVVVSVRLTAVLKMLGAESPSHVLSALPGILSV